MPMTKLLLRNKRYTKRAVWMGKAPAPPPPSAESSTVQEELFAAPPSSPFNLPDASSPLSPFLAPLVKHLEELSLAGRTTFSEISEEDLHRRNIIIALAKALADFGAKPHRAQVTLTTVARALNIPNHIARVEREPDDPHSLRIICTTHDGSHHPSTIVFDHCIDLRRLRKIRHIQRDVMNAKMGLAEAVERLEALPQRKPVARVRDNTLLMVSTPRLVHKYCRGMNRGVKRAGIDAYLLPYRLKRNHL